MLVTWQKKDNLVVQYEDVHAKTYIFTHIFQKCHLQELFTRSLELSVLIAHAQCNNVELSLYFFIAFAYKPAAFSSLFLKLVLCIPAWIVLSRIILGRQGVCMYIPNLDTFPILRQHIFGLSDPPNHSMPKHIFNPITAMGFSAMFTFQLDNNKR